MIEVYAFATPNSLKVPLALEEMGLDYTLHAINIRAGAQKTESFRAINANAKVPVIVDPEAEGGKLTLSESAAILVYLAEKTGKLLPASGHARARVFEQLFFHASALGVAFGNAGYFRKLATEPNPAAIARFGAEADRLVGLLDTLLAAHRYVAGETLSIADIAHFGWFWRRGFAEVSLDAAPHVARWYAELESRPAFQAAIGKVTALAG